MRPDILSPFVSVHCAQFCSLAYSVIGVATYERTSFALISDVIDGWARPREGGLKGAPSSLLLLCLDNIMLCVHVHNAYWVFFEAF